MGTQSGVGPRSQEWKEDAQADMQTARVQIETSTKGVFVEDTEALEASRTGLGKRPQTAQNSPRRP